MTVRQIFFMFFLEPTVTFFRNECQVSFTQFILTIGKSSSIHLFSMKLRQAAKKAKDSTLPEFFILNHQKNIGFLKKKVLQNFFYWLTPLITHKEEN